MLKGRTMMLGDGKRDPRNLGDFGDLITVFLLHVCFEFFYPAIYFTFQDVKRKGAAA